MRGRRWMQPGIKMLESSLQTWTIQRCREHGMYARKVVGVGVRGFPDILVIDQGRHTFAEVKMQTGRVSALQSATHRDLIKHGAEVVIVRGMDGARAFIEHLLLARVGATNIPIREELHATLDTEGLPDRGR